MLIQKNFETKQERIEQKDAELAAISEFAVRSDLSVDDYFIGKMNVANTQVDRSHEQFPVSYLKRFAETLPGKSLMPGHDYSQMPIGRFYSASVVKAGDVHHLVGKYFIDAKDERTVRGIELGVLKDVSIGFKAGGRQCNLCSKEYVPWFSMMAEGSKANAGADYCEHEPGKSYDGQTATLVYTQPKLAEAMETSFVWLGCQYDANTTREAKLLKEMATLGFIHDPRSLKERLTMPELEELRAQLAAAAAEIAEKTALLKALEPAVQEQALYRSWIKSEITRLYTSMEMADTGAAILSGLESANAETLEKVRQNADELHKKRFTPAGAAHTNGPDDTKDELSRPRGFDPTRPRTLFGRNA